MLFYALRKKEIDTLAFLWYHFQKLNKSMIILTFNDSPERNASVAKYYFCLFECLRILYDMINVEALLIDYLQTCGIGRRA